MFDELTKVAHDRLASYPTKGKLLRVGNLNVNVKASDIQSKLVKLAKPFVAPYPNAIYLEAGDEADKHTGHAIIELINAPLYETCCKVLRNAPDLREGQSELTFARVVFEPSSPDQSSPSSDAKPESGSPAKDPAEGELLSKMIKSHMLQEDGSCSMVVKDAILEIMEDDSVLEKDLTADCNTRILLTALMDPGSPSRPQHSKAQCAPPHYKEKLGGLFKKIATGPDRSLQHADVCTYAATICNDSPVRFALAFFEQGFDLHLERFRWPSHSHMTAMFVCEEWTHAKDAQLVRFMNETILKLKVSWKLFCPDYLQIDRGVARPDLDQIWDIPLPSLRTRASMILELNERVMQLLPSVDFRGAALPRSTKHLLSVSRNLLLYDLKVEWLRSNLDETAQREDQNGPEINLDQLETVNDDVGDTVIQNTQFMQSLLQMESIDPKLLRTKVARGGDPQFPVIIKFASSTPDQAVAGTSGSFREFLCRMVNELREKRLPLFMDCLSTDTARMILRPGPMTFPIAKMLEYVGQLIGIALRADVPILLDLLPCFWKTLVGDPLSFEDIVGADPLTAKMIVRLREVKTEEEYAAFIDDEDSESPLWPVPFIDRSTSDPADMVTPVAWSSRNKYADELESLRLRELASNTRLNAIRRGLQSIVPVDLLSVMTWQVCICLFACLCVYVCVGAGCVGGRGHVL